MATVVGDLLSSLTVPIPSILVAIVVGASFLYWFIMGQDELDDAMADVSLPELMERLRDHVEAVNNGGNGIGQRHNAVNVLPVPRNAVNNPANLVNNNNHHNRNNQAPPPPPPLPPQWNWDWMLLRLRTHPEEAAAYCHTVDPPPLLQVLQLGGHPIPPRVVHAFLEAYEDAALHSDQYGTTPLLAAVQRIQYEPLVPTTVQQDDEHQQQQDQCEIVQALLQANSYAAQQPNCQGQVPLHLVRTNSKLVKRLLDVFPEGVDASDHQGRLPLHYVCRQYESSEEDDDDDNENDANDAQPPQQQQDENDIGHDEVPQLPQQQEIARDADNHNDDDEEEESHEEPPPPPKRLILPDPEVAKLLLQSSSSNSSSLALCQDNNGITPLHILYQELKDVLLQLKELDSNHATLDTLWVILTILVQSASAAVSTPITPLKGNANFQMVHALVALQCPATVMTEALRRYPEQAIQRDAHGRTPLLLAVEILGQHAQDITPSTTTTNKPDEMAAVVCALIKCNPTAARMTDQEGRLAIDLLSEIGYYDSDLFEAMVMAEPRAIDTRDLKNKQHPFLTAALASNRNQVAASVYHLLRAKPHVIQFFMDDIKHK